MGSSVAAYATLVGAKARLGITDATDDALIQSFCDQVNDEIEETTHRVIAPIPQFKANLGAAANVGDQVVTVPLVGGLAVGDSLAFGPVTGTHESASVLDITGTQVTMSTPLAFAYASNAPVERVYVYDGFDALEGRRCLPVAKGLRFVTALEVATFSAGAGGSQGQNVVWYKLPATDYFLRPSPQVRPTGWPATELWITNVPQPSDVTPSFYPGFANVRIWGGLGFPAMLDSIVRVALNVVVSAYRDRGAGGAEQTEIDTGGARTILRYLSSLDRRVLERFTDIGAQAFIV